MGRRSALGERDPVGVDWAAGWAEEVPRHPVRPARPIRPGRPGRHRRPGSPSRFAIACGAVVFQTSLGGIYAWSVLGQALQAEFRLAPSETVLPFSVAIGVVFIGTFLGGRLQDRRGPRTAALLGGVLYSLGSLGASLVTDRAWFWVLLLTYGVVGGLGLGIAYIVPVAMLQKWYPEKRGIITGVAVGGFGFGATLTSPLARHLLDVYEETPTHVFLPLGLMCLVLTTGGAALFRDPPPATGAAAAARARTSDFTCAAALRTRQWYMLTTILTLNTISGIGFVAVTAASAISVTGISPDEAATLTGIMGLFNGAGRIFWGWLSERLGRMRIFTVILAVQGCCLLAMPYAGEPYLFVALAAVIYAGFGGGFAVMPATAADFFGLTHAGAIYGLMNVAWSIGGVVGPLLAAALAAGGSYDQAFVVLASIALSATVLPTLTRAPGRRSAARSRTHQLTHGG